MRAFKFRIYPNKEQQELFERTFGSVRFLYNRMLSDKIEYYELHKKMLINTPAQYKKEFNWLREVDSLALCNAQLHLETAFRNFFRNPGKIGFPAFKAKHRSKFSYTTNRIGNNVVLGERHIKLPKLGNVKAVVHRTPTTGYKLKSVTVTKTPSGKYYAALLYDTPATVIEKVPETIIGLDFSMPKLFVSSENASAEYPKYYQQAEKRLRQHQKTLSRRRKGSARYFKQRHKVAVLHEKVANQRKDFLHKLSGSIAKNYDLVCIENLDMRGMSGSLKLGKSVHDNGWGMFRSFLVYKTAAEGGSVAVVSKWFPSSKTCSVCGKVLSELKLSQRVFRCECGHFEDRDTNAARNIRDEGLKNYMAAGHAVSAQLCCAHESTRLRSPHLKVSA